MTFVERAAVPEDAAGIAKVHVASWQVATSSRRRRRLAALRVLGLV